jgi:hypothetical protein
MSCLSVPRASAQLVRAEAFLDVDAGVSASGPENPLESETFSNGPRSFDLLGVDDSIGWNLNVTAGGQAETVGTIDYRAITTYEIVTTGDFSFATLASPPVSALGGFDATLRIDFEVASVVTFLLSGEVSTRRDLDAPEVVACTYNGVVLAGDTRATPLGAGTYAFSVERTLFPGEVGSLQCAAASSGGLTDLNELTWRATVEGLDPVPEPGALLASFGALAALLGIGLAAPRVADPHIPGSDTRRSRHHRPPAS